VSTVQKRTTPPGLKSICFAFHWQPWRLMALDFLSVSLFKSLEAPVHFSARVTSGQAQTHLPSAFSAFSALKDLPFVAYPNTNKE
jgi:hypothetical protein